MHSPDKIVQFLVSEPTLSLIVIESLHSLPAPSHTSKSYLPTAKGALVPDKVVPSFFSNPLP